MRPALRPFANEITELRPTGASITDIHTHLGVDEDGHRLTLEGLLRQLDRVDIARAAVFALHDPDRGRDYRVPNERIYQWAQESGGRLVPFCRLDPGPDAVAEGERALAAGARGIKLHPRAQKFSFDGPETREIFALADAHRVPVLIHAGRGMPPIADGLARTALAYPNVGLVLAHAAICDQALLTDLLADHPRVVYDTSIFAPLDLLELYSRVGPERVVFGSDPPYGRPMLGLYVTLRVARAVGLGDDQVRLLLSGTGEAILAGEPLPPVSAPLRGREIRWSGACARAYGYLSMAFAGLMRGERAGAAGSVDMARSVCRDPQQRGSDELDRLDEVLAHIQQALGEPDERAPHDLVYLAMALAATTAL